VSRSTGRGLGFEIVCVFLVKGTPSESQTNNAVIEISDVIVSFNEDSVDPLDQLSNLYPSFGCATMVTDDPDV